MRFIGTTNARSQIAVVICCIMMLLFAFLGCAGNPSATPTAASDLSQNDLRKITNIAVSEDSSNVILSIEGSSDLLFSDIRKTSPPEVTFYFPGTELDGLDDQYNVGLDPVEHVNTSAVVADGQTAKISVSLRREALYSIEQSDKGIAITFSKEAVVDQQSADEIPAADMDAPIDDASADLASAPKGTCIETFNVQKHTDGIDVIVAADGQIQDYTAFTIDNPPRIVFDIYNIKSPYKGLQKVEVDSKWVTGLRHFCYPDKLRIVLDTDRAYMTSFASKPLKNGLMISVSEQQPVIREDLILPATVEQVAANEPAETVAKDVKTEQKTPAWLNKIEFTGAEGGESLVSIGTTDAVRYDMQQVNDRKLQLELFDTRVPQYRKRPLITTRFESAVDRITPVQTPKMGNNAVIVFDLREAVPYEIEQDANFIFIRFAPSKIPPKPMEATAEPEWKKALSGTETDKTTNNSAPLAAKAEVKQGTTEIAAATSPAESKDESKKWGATSEVLMDEGNVVKRVDETILSKPKVYTGEKIALNFYDTDIKNVFRILGEISGQNFAIDKDVTGKVTLNFEKPVPWDQVLDLVLRMNQLGLKMDQGIYRIATQATLAREAKLESEKLEAARKKDEEEELVTEFFLCSYINARDTACAHLARTCSDPNEVGWDSKFSPRGTISVDVDKNMIVVNDIPKAVERIREIIRILDQVTPQVLIEARIVEATTDFTRDIGFDWGTISIGSFDLGNVFQVTGIDMTADNIPVTALDNGSIGFGLSKLSGTSFDIIDARLQLGESEGKTRIISAPKILTLDGKLAVIKQGFEIAYLERDSAGGSSVKFKNVDLELRVRPKVTPDNRVMLAVQVQKDDVTDLTAQNPPLSTNQANTELLLEDSETIVIGGIIKATVSEGEEGIPGLRKIPGLGMMFKYSSKTDAQRELLIFLTPKIVKLAQKEVKSTKF
jgi:type IV pilus assembly protein PilQ